MTKIMIYGLLYDLISGVKYEEIYVKDGDSNLHIIDVIDIYNEKIYCRDGWYHYFDAFSEDGNCELYKKD